MEGFRKLFGLSKEKEKEPSPTFSLPTFDITRETLFDPATEMPSAGQQADTSSGDPDIDGLLDSTSPDFPLFLATLLAQQPADEAEEGAESTPPSGDKLLADAKAAYKSWVMQNPPTVPGWSELIKNFHLPLLRTLVELDGVAEAITPDTAWALQPEQADITYDRLSCHFSPKQQSWLVDAHEKVYGRHKRGLPPLPLSPEGLAAVDTDSLARILYVCFIVPGNDLGDNDVAEAIVRKAEREGRLAPVLDSIGVKDPNKAQRLRLDFDEGRYLLLAIEVLKAVYGGVAFGQLGIKGRIRLYRNQVRSLRLQFCHRIGLGSPSSPRSPSTSLISGRMDYFVVGNFLNQSIHSE
ncbi:hypothetical protein JCM11641_004612 [Rhodosporidiobolus odoratus]